MHHQTGQNLTPPAAASYYLTLPVPQYKDRMNVRTSPRPDRSRKSRSSGRRAHTTVQRTRAVLVGPDVGSGSISRADTSRRSLTRQEGRGSDGVQGAECGAACARASTSRCGVRVNRGKSKMEREEGPRPRTRMFSPAHGREAASGLEVAPKEGPGLQLDLRGLLLHLLLYTLVVSRLPPRSVHSGFGSKPLGFVHTSQELC